MILVVLVLAGIQLPTLLHTTYERLSAPGVSPAVRELAPAATHDVSPMALTLAAQTIPPGATYTVVVGKTPPVGSTTALAIPIIFQDRLLPRRYTPTLADAQWVVTYHQSSERLGVPYKREIGLGPDANAVELG